MKRLVGKRFVAGGKRLVPGDVVDVTGWRNLKVLESGGWLLPTKDSKPEADASPKPIKKATKPSDGSENNE